jgi:signal transduction histidine kinase
MALALVMVAGIGMGVWSESRAYGWDQPVLWFPDLLVGLAWSGVSVAVWVSGRRGPALVCAAVGALWFLGGLWPAAAALHRGPLVHAMVCFPRLRPRSRTGHVVVAAAYATSMVASLWQAEVANAALAIGVLAAVILDRRPFGSPWASRSTLVGADRWLTGAAAAWAAAVLATALLRSALGVAGVVPALLLYETAAVASALVVGWYASRGREGLADLVVELGQSPSQPVRDALAGLLGDPGLRIGYWDPVGATYADSFGATVDLPTPEGPVRATTVDHRGSPFAVIVHDRALLTDPGLVGVLQRALHLVARNTELNSEVQARLEEVSMSRRRLAVAATDERARLERRLDREALGHLSAALTRLQHDGLKSDVQLSEAVDLLDRAVGDLRELAKGLYPAALNAGLESALGALSEGSPVPVELTVVSPRAPAEVEAAVYFSCAEALANVVKHAAASRATLTVRLAGGALVAEVSDDGHGGADLDGSGLVGIRDRVEALGGRLTVSSGPSGTLVRAEVPALWAIAPATRR